MAEKLMENILENLADNVPKQKAASFGEEASSSVTSQINRLFGRQKPVHHVLGGGKSADVLLWRNKKISASVLMGATAIWVLFEWLNYHFLTLLFFALLLEVFANIGLSIGAQVNQALAFLQDISRRGELKQFLLVAVSLWVAAVIGSWCNFLTVIYVGFVAAHTLPVFYEKYEDQVDSFVYNIFGQLQNHYQKLDSGLLSKIPKGRLGRKKSE